MRMQMMDFAKQDHRSVHAGLHGKDDGRVRCYERIFGALFASDKDMAQHDLIHTVGDCMDRELPRHRRWRLNLLGLLKATFEGATLGLRCAGIVLIGVSLAWGLIDLFCAGG
jgi:hypothetical protein